MYSVICFYIFQKGMKSVLNDKTVVMEMPSAATSGPFEELFYIVGQFLTFTFCNLNQVQR